ncbi:MAG TPA: hypothetical protein VJ764_08095 [Steroidobacteraceae bacterium]|nr:hypothetical protein [Steroidobacteraceae bacterium]
MKTCTETRTLAAARTIVAIAAFALASCAADDLTETATTGQQPCAGHEPTQTISLEDAQGRSFRLAHFSDCGWKYLPSRAESGPTLGKLSLSPVAESRADTPIEDPLAVFVDGPTGYTFAYIREAGWKFVGHVIGDNP